MTGRYRSGKYIPDIARHVPMITAADPVFIPFRFRVSGTIVFGQMSPDQSKTESEMPASFIVFLSGLQPIGLYYRGCETWEMNVGDEYREFADLLGWCVFAWYQ